MPLVQQRDNVILVSSTSMLRNNSELESTTDWSNSNPTFPPIKNITVSSSPDVSVEAILNTTHDHQLKKGAGIRDTLAGIRNRFG